jgi:DUF1680 family protein
MRLLASLGQYVATMDDTGVQIHLFNSTTIATVLASGNSVTLTMNTNYPWDGYIKLVVAETDGSTWSLRLRLPDWCQKTQLTVNGQPVEKLTIESGYALLERTWQTGDVVELELAIEPHLFEPHPRIDAVRDSVAVQYGPLVYCLEEEDVAANLMDVQVDETTPLKAAWCDNLVSEGIIVIKATGQIINVGGWQDIYRPLSGNNLYAPAKERISLKMIPYYTWGNRKRGAMRVWIPRVERK